MKKGQETPSSRRLEKSERGKPTFKKGQTVWIALHGAGITTYEECKIGFVRDGKFFIDNGPGNDPSGPFDAKTGKYLGNTVFGFSMNALTEKSTGGES